MRTIYVYDHATGKVVEKGKQSVKPVTQVINDVMEPVRSMLDGKWYDSKSRLRRSYRAAGRYEVGNDCVGDKEWNHGEEGPEKPKDEAHFEWQEPDFS